ncbi:MAG: cobalt ECF transporter T component CbiQ [Methanocalculus sp. MSAO_Arc1]|uniref:cobalt ECF transporter T component CbiQ n=1 Tax=Methanocalculus TaxID=71151 RepID=UPI000FF2B585|nr:MULTISPECIES: cobalt ECF transporter T component CbiQ [unclassified Methanocalculus]MCP1662409.1 cobalt/nickel transport system permease protein [Methanocalculus sp. AMF5]RQD79474.1 MAG: cobalt ECF transporter T component CbiQ [Methanocalculus sp. MSAO_Arc1]
MDYPDIDKYANLNSAIHRLEPRCKVISFTILIFSAVFVETLHLALLALLIAITILIISRLPLAFVVRRSKVILVFILPILILMPLTVPGTPLWQAGPVIFSEEGFFFALLITLRSVAAITLVLTLLGTQRFDTTLKALSLLKVPGILIQMLFFTYRYIYVMMDEFLSIWSAMRAKGYSFRLNRYGLSIIGNLVGMLLVKSYERAERVFLGMQAKGYQGRPMSFAPFAIRRSDCFMCLILISIAGGLLIYPLVIT